MSDMPPTAVVAFVFKVPCEECKGLGFVPATPHMSARECPYCSGSGRMYHTQRVYDVTVRRNGCEVTFDLPQEQADQLIAGLENKTFDHCVIAGEDE